MSLGLQNDLKWAVLCEKVLGRPDLTADERFATNPNWVAHDDELTGIIEAALGTMTSDEAVALLADHRARPRSRDGRHPGTWPAH